MCAKFSPERVYSLFYWNITQVRFRFLIILSADYHSLRTANEKQGEVASTGELLGKSEVL